MSQDILDANAKLAYAVEAINTPELKDTYALLGGDVLIQGLARYGLEAQTVVNMGMRATGEQREKAIAFYANTVENLLYQVNSINETECLAPRALASIKREIAKIGCVLNAHGYEEANLMMAAHPDKGGGLSY